MKLNIIKSRQTVTVITPSVGASTVQSAVKSVERQDYQGDIVHVVVADGMIHSEACEKQLAQVQPTQQRRRLLGVTVPFNTGGDGYYGHRIYSAFSFLINTPIVMFLDEDNWYEPNHVSTLVQTIETYGFDWAYSLRSVWDGDEFFMRDNCESLGAWPHMYGVVNKPTYHLIDTSCYAFKVEFLRTVGGAWCNKWGGDRIFLDTVLHKLKHRNFGTSGRYTLNYRLGSPTGPKPEFFYNCNSKMAERHSAFPWDAESPLFTSQRQDFPNE